MKNYYIVGDIMVRIVLDPDKQCRYDIRIDYSPLNKLYIDLSRIKPNPSGIPANIDYWVASIEFLNTYLPINIPLGKTKEGIEIVTSTLQLALHIVFKRNGESYVVTSIYPRKGYRNYTFTGSITPLSSISGILIDNCTLYYVYRDGSRKQVFSFNKIEEIYGYNKLLATICVKKGGYVVPFKGEITITYTPGKPQYMSKPSPKPSPTPKSQSKPSQEEKAVVVGGEGKKHILAQKQAVQPRLSLGKIVLPLVVIGGLVYLVSREKK